MLNRFLKILVFIGVFAAGVVFFTGFLNTEKPVGASDPEGPTLPLMYLDLGGVKADRMYGHKQEDRAAGFRDVLIPVSTTRTISVSYKPYGNEIISASYEITAPDTGEVVTNARIGNFKSDGDYMTAEISLNTPILLNREYPVRFTLETRAGPVHFYARLIQRSTNDPQEFVQFVYDFYESCLNKQGASGLSIYMETDETVTSKSLSRVTLKSTLDQVTWGDLAPSLYRKGIPAIREISGSLCTLTNEYMLSAREDNGATSLFRVREYYRLRRDAARMRVLNFERTCTEVFDPEKADVITPTGFTVGISEPDLTVETDETGQFAAFVVDRDLWIYSHTAQKMTNVFSFHDHSGDGDERTDHNDFGVRLVRVTAGGDVDFMVYGYMNRGHYEGRQGVLICRYLSESSAVEEKAFVPDPRSTDQIAHDMAVLSSVTADNKAWLYLDRRLIRVGLSDRSLAVVLDDIDPDAFVTPVSGTAVAWCDEMTPEAGTHLTVLSLSSGAERHIEAPDGCYVKPLGFINDDFIYGTADRDDIRSDGRSGTVFAMKSLTIEDLAGNTILEYEKPGYYISSVTIKSGLIELERVTRDENGRYAAAPNDNIMSNQGKTALVSQKTRADSRKGRVLTLVTPYTIRNIHALVNTAQVRDSSSGTLTAPERGPSAYPVYRIYTGGRLSAFARDPAEAVRLADEGYGTALCEDGRYLYERGGAATEKEIVNEAIIDVFKSGTHDIEKLRAGAGEGVEIVDLSGCTLQQVLYQVSRDRPVLTRTSDGTTILIVGYNRYNTRLYNFEDGSHYWYGINDSTAAFESGGNLFITYLEPEETIRKTAG